MGTHSDGSSSSFVSGQCDVDGVGAGVGAFVVAEVVVAFVVVAVVAVVQLAAAPLPSEFFEHMHAGHAHGWPLVAQRLRL